MKKLILSVCVLALCGAAAPKQPVHPKVAQALRLNDLINGELRRPESQRTLTPAMIALAHAEMQRLLDEVNGKHIAPKFPGEYPTPKAPPPPAPAPFVPPTPGK